MKWRRWLLVGALVVVVTVILSAVWREREPRYKGSSLSEWLRIHYRYAGQAQGDEAAEAIRQIGARAVPFLLADGVRRNPTMWAQLISRAGSHWPGKRRFDGFSQRESPDRQQLAQDGFYILGAAAGPAVNPLLDLLGTTGLYSGAPQALASVGGPAIVPLMQIITNRGHALQKREAAVYALGLMGTNASCSVAVLLRCVNDEPNVKVSREAAIAIGRVVIEVAPVISVLTNSLRSGSVDRRIAAAGALGGLGSRARSAVPVLKACLFDDVMDIRLMATNALAEIAPDEFGTANR